MGTILCGKLWAAHDFSPVALIRDSRQATKFTALGVPAVTGDLEAGVADFLPGLDAVVFTAGSGGHTGPEKTTDVDQNAAIRLMDDCVKADLKRFVMISAIGADPNSESERIRHYLSGQRCGGRLPAVLRVGFYHPCSGYSPQRAWSGPGTGRRGYGLSRVFAP